MPTGPFSLKSGREGGIRWEPPLSVMADRIEGLRDPFYNEVFERLAPLAQAMRAGAQKSARYRIETPRARPGLFSYRIRTGKTMGIGLAHGPRTYQRGFYYGVALESFVYRDLGFAGKGPMRTRVFPEMSPEEGQVATFSQGRGSLAVIMPTIDAFGERLLATMSGILNEVVGRGG